MVRGFLRKEVVWVKKRRLVFLFAICSFFLISSLTFSAVNNIKISGDITAQAITRDLSLGLGATKLLPLFTTESAKDSEDFLLLQTRLRFDADLTENVSAVVQLINERLWGEENNANTDIDLDLAYFTLKEMISPHLTLTIGRQPLRFGNAFIVGDPDTNRSVSSASGLYRVADDLSLRKGFDAIRANLDYDNFILDLIYAVINESSTNIADDVSLYGVNARYLPDETILYELYFFAKDKDYDTYNSSLLGPTTLQDEENKVYCLGTHIKKDFSEKLTLNFEVAHQFGDYRDGSGLHAQRDAWAGQLGLDYKLLNKAYSILGFWYTFLSGDGDQYSSATGSAGSTYTAWDPMFEDQTGGELINLILPHTNSHTINLYFFTYLRKNLNMLIKYTHQRLVKNHFSDRYAIAEGPAYGNYYYLDRSSKHLGDEIDLKLTYDYSENTQFILDSGVFIPGGLLASENDNTAYMVRLSAKVNF